MVGDGPLINFYKYDKNVFNVYLFWTIMIHAHNSHGYWARTESLFRNNFCCNQNCGGMAQVVKLMVFIHTLLKPEVTGSFPVFQKYRITRMML